MAFVKLDCGILDSTIWVDRIARELFITALLMAEPTEIYEPEPAMQIRSLDDSGFLVPPGWYGFVPAAGPGIVRRAGVDLEEGLAALERLASPELDSRTPDHEGRRMVRIDGGYLILNYDKYRQKDHTAAERSRRYREKKLLSRVTDVASRVTSRSVTQAEAEAEAEAEDSNPPTPQGASASPSLGQGKKDIFPTTEESKAISDLFSRRHSTAWSSKEIAAYRDGVRRGIITREAIEKIRFYYEAERAKGNQGIHRRDLKTFLNNFDGELDRAEQFLRNGNGRMKEPVYDPNEKF